MGNILLEVALEFLIRGPGHLLCKSFKRNVNPEGALVVLVGIAFWAIVAVGAWFIYQEVSEFVAIDKCLDSGGAFDRQLQKYITS